MTQPRCRAVESADLAATGPCYAQVHVLSGRLERPSEAGRPERVFNHIWNHIWLTHI